MIVNGSGAGTSSSGTPKPNSRLQLRYVSREAAYAQVFISLTGGAFLTGLALFLGASDFEIGLVTALPFIAQIAQLLSPWLMPFLGGRKGITVLGLTIGRLVWLPLIPALFFPGAWRLYLLFAVLLVSSIATMAATPSWFSWMADIVPRRIRGRFFGTRSAVIAISTLIATVGGSVALDLFVVRDKDASGYGLLLALALMTGFWALRVMKRLPDSSKPIEPSRYDLQEMLRPLSDKKFRSLLKVFFSWNLSIGLSAGFFAPHMLLNLKMSFFQIGLYSAAATIVAIATNRPWGKVIDRFGPRAVLTACAAGISMIPLIWLFPRADYLWVLIPEAIYSGLCWTGFNLAAFTIPLDKSPREKRPAYLAMFAVVTGIAFFIGSVLAGFIADVYAEMAIVVGAQVLVNYHILFVVSAIMRMLTAAMLASLRGPAEVRLPVMIQLMGYAVLKRMSISRQLVPFAIDDGSDDDADNTQNNHT
ncbi:MAG: MFS transporter [Candidatus Zixiibacteriota bacterium]